MKFHLLLSYVHLRCNGKKNATIADLGIPAKPLRCSTTKLGPSSAFLTIDSVLIGRREDSSVTRLFHDFGTSLAANLRLSSSRYSFCSSKSRLVYFERNSRPSNIHFAKASGNNMADWAVCRVKLQEVYMLESVVWLGGCHFVLFAEQLHRGFRAGIVRLDSWLESEVFWPGTFKFDTWRCGEIYAPFGLLAQDEALTTDWRLNCLFFLDLQSGESRELQVARLSTPSFQPDNIKSTLHLVCNPKHVLVATVSVSFFDSCRYTYHAVCVDLDTGCALHHMQMHELSIDDHEKTIFKTFKKNNALLGFLLTEASDYKIVRWCSKQARLVLLASPGPAQLGFKDFVQAAVKQTVFHRFAWNHPRHRLILWTVAKTPQKGRLCILLHRFRINM